MQRLSFPFAPTDLRRLLLLLLGLLVPFHLAAGQSRSGRSSDSLLYRTSLQTLVEAQTAREATPLIEALEDAQAPVRARAAFALGSVQDSTALPALLERLHDSDPAVRADVAFALGQNDGSVPAAPLFEAFQKEHRLEVQRFLLEALGKKGDQSSLQRLATLEVPDALESTLALAIGRYALRDLHAPAAVDRLLNLLKSSDPVARRYAAYYFGRSSETEPWADRADIVRRRLDALDDDDPTAFHLIRGLHRLEDSSDRSRFVRWLEEATDWRIRVEAARALAQPADTSWTARQRTNEALLAALDAPSTHVRVAAAEALSQNAPWSEADAEAIQRWMQRFPNAWHVGAPLLHGFATTGREAVVTDWLSRWEERSPWAYAKGLRTLGQFDSPGATDRLFEAANHTDARIAAAALDALAERWQEDHADTSRAERYFEAFAQGLRRGDLATMYAAAPVLADSRFQPFGATDLMQAVYDTLQTPRDIEPMTALLQGLSEAGDTSAVPLLEHALEHEHPVVRRAAAGAFEALTGESVQAPARPLPSAPRIDWEYLRSLGRQPHLVLETDEGSITLAFDTEEAPLTTQTLFQLAERGAYDGVPFHRVVPNFVIQGGDFAREDGFGGPGFFIRSEFTRLPYERGAAGMASAGKDTEGSQFFITHSMQPHLHGRYTAFGRVEEGMDVVDRLLVGDRIVRARVVRSRD